MLTSYGQREAVLIIALKQLLQNHSKLKFPLQIMVNVHNLLPLSWQIENLLVIRSI